MNTSDLRNIWSKITLKRSWNAFKIYTSFYISKWLRYPVHWGMPVALTIEPTTACNLKCPECPSGLRSFTRATGSLQEELFERIIDQAHEQLCCLIFYFQGEPYINKGFLNMVRYAAQKNIYTITSTNGHFLNDQNARETIESGLDRLIISVDGTTQEVYEQYRKGGKLENVLQGARNIIKWKKQLNSPTPHIIFQFLVVRPNQHQIEDLYHLADKIGVDEVRLKTAQIYDYKLGSPLIPTIEKYARYKKNTDGTFSIKNQLKNQCWKLWHAAVVTWDGKVAPCCFDKDLSHPMGDLERDSFKSIWRGPIYQEFRQRILHGRKNISICTNCTEGCKVWK